MKKYHDWDGPLAIACFGWVLNLGEAMRTTTIGWLALGLFAFAFVLFGVAIKADSDAQDAFMAECRKDKKQYECTAMWRAGDSHVAPIPIVIPVR
jgi:hypothetical protein